jgi:hypothetical protein
MARFSRGFGSFLAGRGVALLFGLQVALFVGAHAATNAGLETLGEYLGIVIDGAILALVLAVELLPWYPDVALDGALLSDVVLLGYLAVYYLVAVALAVPGRAVYRLGRRRLAR